VGDFTGIRKERKISAINECYSLGMRLLAMVFDSLRKDLDDYISFGLEGEHDDSSQAKTCGVQRFVYLTVLLFVLVILRAISGAAGSRSLRDVYAVLSANNESASYRIMDFIVRMDHLDRFPEMELSGLIGAVEPNTFAHNLVRLLVFDHLHLARTEIARKQRICNEVGISMQRVRVEEYRSISAPSAVI